MRKDILKLISEIQVLAAQVSSETKHDVFASYYGHVQSFEVAVSLGGWNSKKGDNRKVLLEDLFLGEYSNAVIVKNLRRVKRELNQLLEE